MEPDSLFNFQTDCITSPLPIQGGSKTSYRAGWPVTLPTVASRLSQWDKGVRR